MKPLDPRQIADLLGVGVRAVYDLVAHAGLPAVRVHDDLRTHPDALFTWAVSTGRALPRGFFSAEQHLVPVLGRVVFARPDPSAPLATALLGTFPPEAGAFTGGMAARPALGFVTVAGRFALPRLSEPLVAGGLPRLSVCHFERPPLGVATIFLPILAPTVHLHRCLVAELYAALQDARFVDALVRGADGAELAALVREPASMAAK